MGQYWKPVNISKGLAVKMPWLKLMEHSWLANPWCKYVFDRLATNWDWDRMAWIWDYTEDGDIPWMNTRVLYDDTPIRKEFVHQEEYRSRYNNTKWYLINYSRKEFLNR